MGPRAARVSAVDEPGAEGSTAPRGVWGVAPSAPLPPHRPLFAHTVKPRRALTNASYRQPTRRVFARAAAAVRARHVNFCVLLTYARYKMNSRKHRARSGANPNVTDSEYVSSAQRQWNALDASAHLSLLKSSKFRYDLF